MYSKSVNSNYTNTAGAISAIMGRAESYNDDEIKQTFEVTYSLLTRMLSDDSTINDAITKLEYPELRELFLECNASTEFEDMYFSISFISAVVAYMVFEPPLNKGLLNAMHETYVMKPK
jgi:hypothetical protein